MTYRLLVFLFMSFTISSCIQPVRGTQSSSNSSPDKTSLLESSELPNTDPEPITIVDETTSDTEQVCENNYVKVEDFCVSRKEIYGLTTGSTVLVKDPASASNICIVRGKKLLNHDQWMKIAKKIELNPRNYKMGEPNKFQFAQQLFISDTQTIEHFISSHYEWVAWSESSLFLPYNCQPISGPASMHLCSGKQIGSIDFQLKIGGQATDAGLIINYLDNKYVTFPALVRSGTRPVFNSPSSIYDGIIGEVPAQVGKAFRCAYKL